MPSVRTDNKETLVCEHVRIIVASLEHDLDVPVIEPVLARAWEIQKLLHMRIPIPGHGHLLAELP
jgi:maleate cis-trans isomerase